jgi:uncharacterized protein (TIGR03067 family)
MVVGLVSATGCLRSHSSKGPIEQDLDRLQGTWQVESSLWNGVQDPPASRLMTILFEGEKFIVIDRDGNRQVERIKLMPGQNPKAIDCWSKDGGIQPSPGIYSLEGDTFTWCSSGGGNKVRPVTFESKPGSKRSLMILKRKIGNR